MRVCFRFLQMRPLSCVPYQRDGGPGPRSLCAGHPGPIHRPRVAAGAPRAARTRDPAQPHPRDSAAGLCHTVTVNQYARMCTACAVTLSGEAVITSTLNDQVFI